jgi:environmental stress-induced protein Ves
MSARRRSELFNRFSLPATPWKNGGGVTREIVRMPPGADMDSFDWRVSIAEISADGEFSRFPGVDRTIILLEGDGVYMDAVDHRLDTPLLPFAFSGDEHISAKLLGGTSIDFNVMTRRSKVRASVRVIRGTETLAKSRAGVLFAAKGAWTVGNHGLSDDTGIWWNDSPFEWTLTTSSENAALISVSIHDR